MLTTIVCSQLFKESRRICPKDSTQATDIDLEAGMHIFPFTIGFPVSRYQASGDCPPQYCIPADLPPSIKVSTPGLKASICYLLAATVERKGAFKFNPVAQDELQFRLPNPQQLPLATNVASQRACAPRPGLHTRTPSVRLELRTPKPLVLFPQQPLPVSLAISTPHIIQDKEAGYLLHQLRFRLRTKTVVCTASASRAHISYDLICSVTGVTSITPPPGEAVCLLESGMWQNHLVPQVAPSFLSLGISRTHSLEVAASISRRGDQYPEVCSR